MININLQLRLLQKGILIVASRRLKWKYYANNENNNTGSTKGGSNQVTCQFVGGNKIPGAEELKCSEVIKRPNDDATRWPRQHRVEGGSAQERELPSTSSQ